ncbi:MAG: colanic acid biosynthesis glycosyltransferase WcaI, partial [Pedobacter sp.]
MAQQRVLLLGGNFFPEPTGIGKYNGEMMTWLADQGYDCAVISTYPYYPHWRLQHPYERKGAWYSTE